MAQEINRASGVVSFSSGEGFFSMLTLEHFQDSAVVLPGCAGTLPASGLASGAAADGSALSSGGWEQWLPPMTAAARSLVSEEPVSAEQPPLSFSSLTMLLSPEVTLLAACVLAILIWPRRARRLLRDLVLGPRMF